MTNDENDIAIRAVAMRERVTERNKQIKANSSIGAVFGMEMLEDARGMAVCGFRIWQYGYLHRQFFGSKQFTLAPYPRLLTVLIARVNLQYLQHGFF